MLIAVPIWEGRVSPVFDVAQRLVLSDVEAGRVVNTTELAMPSPGLLGRVEFLAREKVEVLLCGAISGCVRNVLYDHGIRVVPCVCGPVEQVVQAFLENRLVEEGLVMPGCGCGRGAGRGRGLGRGGGARRQGRGWCGNRRGTERTES